MPVVHCLLRLDRTKGKAEPELGSETEDGLPKFPFYSSLWLAGCLVQQCWLFKVSLSLRKIWKTLSVKNPGCPADTTGTFMKILIPTKGQLIAPRFDLATEVIVATCYDQQLLEEPRCLLVAEPSAEALCEMILKEQAKRVICCGIEEEHFRFLSWKKVTVFDSVIGPWKQALGLAAADELRAGDILSCQQTFGSKMSGGQV